MNFVRTNLISVWSLVKHMKTCYKIRWFTIIKIKISKYYIFTESLLCVYTCSNITQQRSQNSDQKNDSRDANGLTQKPKNKRHFNTEYCMKSTSIKCKPKHRDSCFIVLKVVHCNIQQWVNIRLLEVWKKICVYA